MVGNTTTTELVAAAASRRHHRCSCRHELLLCPCFHRLKWPNDNEEKEEKEKEEEEDEKEEKSHTPTVFWSSLSQVPPPFPAREDETAGG